jgi:DNA-binding MarR family transcriptional regulator
MSLRLIPAIHRVTHCVGLFLDQAIEPRVTQGEAHILAHLAEHGASSVAQLHRSLAHKRSTLTSILDRLTAREFVMRKVSETDRRSFIIALTPEGKRLARRVLERLQDLESSAQAGLGQKEVAALQTLLDRLEATAEQLAQALGEHR